MKNQQNLHQECLLYLYNKIQTNKIDLSVNNIGSILFTMCGEILPQTVWEDGKEYVANYLVDDCLDIATTIQQPKGHITNEQIAQIIRPLFEWLNTQFDKDNQSYSLITGII